MVNKSHFGGVSPEHVVLKSFTIQLHTTRGGDADPKCACHKRKQSQNDASRAAGEMVNTM